MVGASTTMCKIYLKIKVYVSNSLTHFTYFTFLKTRKQNSIKLRSFSEKEDIFSPTSI